MTPFREPDLTLMFTVFLLPLMVHASLGNSGALSSAKGRITSNTSQGWGRWLQPRLVTQMKGSQRGLWTIRPLGCGRFIVGPGRGLTPLSPSQGCRDIQSWFCIIWGWFPATCNCSFIMPLKALGGQPFQIFQKNIREQASTKSRKTFPSQVLCQQHRFSPTATVCVCVCVCVCVNTHTPLWKCNPDHCVNDLEMRRWTCLSLRGRAANHPAECGLWVHPGDWTEGPPWAGAFSKFWTVSGEVGVGSLAERRVEVGFRRGLGNNWKCLTLPF